MKRSSTYISVYAFAFILLFGSVGRAIAEDFTFNVPVALYSIPAAYTAAKVVCRCSIVSSVSDKGGRSMAQEIGRGEKDFPITNGTLVGTALIKFNATAGSNPANATDWACSLWLFDKSKNKWAPSDELMYNSHNRSKPYKTSDQGYLK
jgi:hypothetical protein